MNGPCPDGGEHAHVIQGSHLRKVDPGNKISPVNLTFLSESSNRGPSRNEGEAWSGDHTCNVDTQEPGAEGM